MRHGCVDVIYRNVVLDAVDLERKIEAMHLLLGNRKWFQGQSPEAQMLRPLNNSSSCRIKLAIAFGLVTLALVTAANAQFKPCNDIEATGNLIASEPVENSKPLRIFDIPSALFPNEIRDKGTFGTVILKVRFLAGGVIGKILVIQGLPDGLTDEAVKAAKGIRFLPARLNGRLTNSAETVEYNFPEPGHCKTINDLAQSKLDPKP
jgi:hypothetical protein